MCTFLTNRKDSSSSVRYTNAFHGHSFSRPYRMSVSGGTTLTWNTLGSQQTRDDVIQPLTLYMYLYVQVLTVTQKILLNHFGGQGTEWGQRRIKVVFFKNECLTCKLVKEKKTIQEVHKCCNRLEKVFFLDKTLLLKTQEPWSFDYC